MKKIVSMVGVGAMVITLGLGSAFAQQATQQPGSGATVAQSKQPGEVEKDKAAVPKGAVEMKPTTPAPATAGKASDKAGETASDKTTAPKPDTGMKVEKAAPEKGVHKHADSDSGKTPAGTAVVPPADKKPEKDATAKPQTGKESAKPEETKSPVKQ